MAILNFPSSPSDGDIYQSTNGRRYQYDATYETWKFLSSANGNIIIEGLLIRPDGYQYNGVMLMTKKIDNHTLVANDAGNVVTMNAATDKVITIPANASVSFPRGTRVDFLRLGAGEVTIAITTDTLRGANNSYRLAFQNSAATVVKTDWTEWNLVGDLKV